MSKRYKVGSSMYFFKPVPYVNPRLRTNGDINNTIIIESSETFMPDHGLYHVA